MMEGKGRGNMSEKREERNGGGWMKILVACVVMPSVHG